MLALVVGATVAAAMLSVYYDAGVKMRRELRAYGANVMLAPSEGSRFIDQTSIRSLNSGNWDAEVAGAAPYLYVVATCKAGGTEAVRVIVAGLDFNQALKVSPWWKINGIWPENSGVSEKEGSQTFSPDKIGLGQSCVVGSELAKQLGLSSGGKLTLSYGEPESATPEESKAKGSGTSPATISASETVPVDKASPAPDQPAAAAQAKVRTYSISGIVTTGGPEDGQIMMPLAAAQDLSSLNGKLSAVAISVLGRESSVESFARQVDSRIPSARADLVRQISENEGRVLGKLRLTMLLVTLLILIAASLSVATTLTALVIDRQKEIGTMKAIGARENTLLRQFLFELGTFGVTGGIIGYLAGIVLAQPIGRSMFQSSITPRAAVFVVVVVISVAVAAVSGIIPLRRIKKLQPAVILRGE